jgi:hypothetical protein
LGDDYYQCGFSMAGAAFTGEGLAHEKLIFWREYADFSNRR